MGLPERAQGDGGRDEGVGEARAEAGARDRAETVWERARGQQNKEQGAGDRVRLFWTNSAPVLQKSLTEQELPRKNCADKQSKGIDIRTSGKREGGKRINVEQESAPVLMVT